MAKNVRASKIRAEQERDLDVEIGFLEGLARRDGQWSDALKLLGDGYTRRGKIAEGLQIDQQLAQLCPDDGTVFYNLACSYSLSGLPDAAFTALARAFALGWNDLKWLAKDPDMARLRKHPRYKEFLGNIRAAK